MFIFAEEMYAAIDDSSDGNYMQILDQDRPNRPTWLGMSVTFFYPVFRT